MKYAIFALLFVLSIFGLSTIEADNRKYIITREDFYCLTQNIYFESANQPIRGQYAVAKVTLNRMMDERWPNTICEVVWQPKQFSWTHDGKPDRPGNTKDEILVWKRTEEIAYKAIKLWRQGYDETKGAVYFHATYVKPAWRKRVTKTIQIQDHIFYK